jgi:hypothetical protein
VSGASTSGLGDCTGKLGGWGNTRLATHSPTVPQGEDPQTCEGLPSIMVSEGPTSWVGQ